VRRQRRVSGGLSKVYPLWDAAPRKQCGAESWSEGQNNACDVKGTRIIKKTFCKFFHLSSQWWQATQESPQSTQSPPSTSEPSSPSRCATNACAPRLLHRGLHLSRPRRCPQLGRCHVAIGDKLPCLAAGLQCRALASGESLRVSAAAGEENVEWHFACDKDRRGKSVRHCAVRCSAK